MHLKRANNAIVTDASSVRLTFPSQRLFSVRLWQHKLCATLPANININYHLPHRNILPYLYYYTYPNRNKSWKPYCVVRFNMGILASMKYFLKYFCIFEITNSYKITPFTFVNFQVYSHQ